MDRSEHPLRLKIVSDGTMVGTRVEDASSGRRLGMVQQVTWTLDVQEGLATAHLVVGRVQLEVVGPATVTTSSPDNEE